MSFSEAHSVFIWFSNIGTIYNDACEFYTELAQGGFLFYGNEYNEWSRDSYFSYANNEKNFIYNQYNILIIHYVIHITFMCQMIFSAYIFYIKNSIFLFLPIVMIIFKSLNALTIITLKLTALYKLIKNVDKK